MRLQYPMPEDYDSIEEYESALEAYEDALYWEEEKAMEKHYDEKNS